MNIYTEDEALIELLEEGCTNDKRYKRLPKDVIKGYIKAYNHLKAATRIEDLFRIGSLHYERLKGDLKDFESVRCTGRWRLIFQRYYKKVEYRRIDLQRFHLSSRLSPTPPQSLPKPSQDVATLLVRNHTI